MRVLKVITTYNVTDWPDSDDDILKSVYSTLSESVAENLRGKESYIGTNIEVVHVMSADKED